jgi:hypothetical protein
MSEFGSKAEEICSQRVFLGLTHSGHWATRTSNRPRGCNGGQDACHHALFRLESTCFNEPLPHGRQKAVGFRHISAKFFYSDLDLQRLRDEVRKAETKLRIALEEALGSEETCQLNYSGRGTLL